MGKTNTQIVGNAKVSSTYSPRDDLYLFCGNVTPECHTIIIIMENIMIVMIVIKAFCISSSLGLNFIYLSSSFGSRNIAEEIM